MRAVAGVIAAVLALTAPAAAVAARTPAVGGGSFNTAPLLEPGRYRDTILPDEFLYYGIRLGVGQRLHVRARIASPDWQAWSDSTGGFAINLATPLRELLVDPVAEDVLGNGNDSFGPVAPDNMAERLRWNFYGPRARPLREALAESETDTAGTWYVSFNAFTAGQRSVAEFPVAFDLAIDGDAATEPPDATPTPTPTPTASASPRGGASDGDGGGAGSGAIAGLGAAGLVVGLAVSGVLGRRH